MRRTESRPSDLGETSGLGFTHHPRLPQYPEGQEEAQTCFFLTETQNKTECPIVTIVRVTKSGHKPKTNVSKLRMTKMG